MNFLLFKISNSFSKGFITWFNSLFVLLYFNLMKFFSPLKILFSFFCPYFSSFKLFSISIFDIFFFEINVLIIFFVFWSKLLSIVIASDNCWFSSILFLASVAKTDIWDKFKFDFFLFFYYKLNILIKIFIIIIYISIEMFSLWFFLIVS